MNDSLLTVVVPVFNEQDVIDVFYQRLVDSMKDIGIGLEIILVDDGSSDNSSDHIAELASRDDRICVVELSRNFGKEIALTAGLDHANGDAIVVIDADLQDPPELIPVLLQEWQAGYDVVYARRASRKGDTFLKKITAYIFYRVMQSSSRVRIPADTGDFRLLSRRALNALLKLREQHRYMKGLFAWIGYSQKEVLYDREARYSGRTKWSYWKLWNLALEGITSFTTAPLRLSTYMGMLTAGASFIFGIYIIMQKILFGNPIEGYPSMMTIILFLSGMQLISIGVIGEYLGRMFDETKGRPLYLIKKIR
ncbi:MAG TPA: glycosyltransferase, partial [Gammaproteobacteria bacterium]|nr:glycosyltransferase [Gammaproteobacteria bacterium]